MVRRRYRQGPGALAQRCQRSQLKFSIAAIENLSRNILACYKKKGEEEEREAKVDRRRQQGAKMHNFAMTVSTTLGVISALLASALLAVMLSPPDAIHDSQKWVTGTCGTVCNRWERVYDVTAVLALSFQLSALLLMVSVAMGAIFFLSAAMLLFFLGVWCASATVVASSWLASGKLGAIFATVFLGFFTCLTFVFMLPMVVWLSYQFSKGRKLNYANVTNRDGTLHWAAAGRGCCLARFYKGILLKLLAQTADLDLCPPNAATPLAVAAMNGNVRGVQDLLEAGADPDLGRLRDLSTPLHLVVSMHRHAVIEGAAALAADVSYYNIYKSGCRDWNATTAAISAASDAAGVNPASDDAQAVREIAESAAMKPAAVAQRATRTIEDCLAIAQELLIFHADPNKEDTSQITPYKIVMSSSGVAIDAMHDRVLEMKGLLVQYGALVLDAVGA